MGVRWFLRGFLEPFRRRPKTIEQRRNDRIFWTAYAITMTLLLYGLHSYIYWSSDHVASFAQTHGYYR